MLFSAQTIAYLFLGGTGAGHLFASCLWALALNARAHESMWLIRGHAAASFALLFQRCLAGGLVILIAALLCLVGDLGRPDRLLYLFFTPHANILTVGAYAIGIELAVAFALMVVCMKQRRADRSTSCAPTVRWLRIICALLGFVVMVYTGVYLYSMDAVAFWHQPALIAAFLFSSASSGLATMMLISYLSPGDNDILQAVKPLQHVHIAIVALEALSIALFLWQNADNATSAASLALLQSSDLLPAAVIGVGIMALAAPLVLETVSLQSPRPRHIPASDVLCIVGCLMLRYVVVACGMH